jgi:hypothetical protein
MARRKWSFGWIGAPWPPAFALILLACALGPWIAESRGLPQQQPPEAGTRLRIEVSGGDKSVPVDAASVYVRFIIHHQSTRDQKTELDLKTNKEGVALAPIVPRGKITVQVVAEGWKPFGENYEVNQDDQVIKIHLERPPKWY